MQRPKQPTIEIVNEYIQEFEDGEYFSEKALSKLFTAFPKNDQLEEILLKVTVLNSLYYTNIFAVRQVAEHILKCKIDHKLHNHSVEVVNEIATLKIGNKVRRNYSFASKYCSWQVPESYPMYDSYVDKILWEYQRFDRFASFKRADLLDYPNYKSVIEQFKGYYGLLKFGFKQLDEFLWLYGKEYFGT